jgi:hypothetical protein
MTKKRVTPSERVLGVMAQHVAYEVNGGVAGYLRSVEDADNLAGEAALLHLRQLIEFLVGRGGPGEVLRNDRDVWPSDWSLAWQVDDASTAYLRRYLLDIDRYLSHFSIDRAEPAPPVPPPGALPYTTGAVLRRVLGLVAQFLQEAGPGRGGMDVIGQELGRAETALDEE